MENIELKTLIGKHILTGVDFETEAVKQWDDCYEDCEVVRFELDGKTYIAMEDPSDGYRSCMKDCKVVDEKPKNVFDGVEVMGIMKPDGYDKNDTIQFYDIKSGKIVLEIGTDNYDDYYPCWVGRWTPENLHVNGA